MTDNSQLEQVRAQADSLGVTYHHRAGVPKIQGLINSFLVAENAKQNTDIVQSEAPQVMPGAPIAPLRSAAVSGSPTEKPGERPGQRFLDKVQTPTSSKDYNERTKRDRKRTVGKLIRCRIQNMNPLKKDWPGEILSVGSASLGTFKKYIPFGGNEAYHVPKIIFDMMKEKKCSAFFSKRDARGGETRKSRLINEYNIEVLPDLTPAELDDLRKKQDVQRANTV